MIKHANDVEFRLLNVSLANVSFMTKDFLTKDVFTNEVQFSLVRADQLSTECDKTMLSLNELGCFFLFLNTATLSSSSHLSPFFRLQCFFFRLWYRKRKEFFYTVSDYEWSTRHIWQPNEKIPSNEWQTDADNDQLFFVKNELNVQPISNIVKTSCLCIKWYQWYITDIFSLEETAAFFYLFAT